MSSGPIPHPVLIGQPRCDSSGRNHLGGNQRIAIGIFRRFYTMLLDVSYHPSCYWSTLEFKYKEKGHQQLSYSINLSELVIYKTQYPLALFCLSTLPPFSSLLPRVHSHPWSSASSLFWVEGSAFVTSPFSSARDHRRSKRDDRIQQKIEDETLIPVVPASKSLLVS